MIQNLTERRKSKTELDHDHRSPVFLLGPMDDPYWGPTLAGRSRRVTWALVPALRRNPAVFAPTREETHMDMDGLTYGASS